MTSHPFAKRNRAGGFRRADGGLAGPPVVPPRWLDALSERWWALTPRARAILLCALLVGAGLAGAIRATIGSVGPPVRVFVAAHDLEAGHVLSPGDLVSQQWPADLASEVAATAATGTLTAPLPAGSPLTERHVTFRGIAGLVPSGSAAVPIPRELAAGVDVGAYVAVMSADHDDWGVALAERARVIAVDETSVWTAVPRGVAPAVAGAALRGMVTLVLLPPPASGEEESGGRAPSPSRP